MNSDVTTDFLIEKGNPEEMASEFKLAKECADLLQSHYPGHLWAVSINTEGGIAVVKNMAISTIYGYVIHLVNLLNDPKRRKIIKAGGEILERATLARKYNGDSAKYVDGLPDNKQPINGIIT